MHPIKFIVKTATQSFEFTQRARARGYMVILRSQGIACELVPVFKV